MLNDILHPSQKDQVVAVGSVSDATGWKRLDKLNSFIQKSSPLKEKTMARHLNGHKKGLNHGRLPLRKEEGVP